VQQTCGGSSSCEQEVAGNLAKAEAKIAFTAYGGSNVSGAIRALVAFFVRQPKSEQSNPSLGNTNPYDGPVDDAVTVVDSDANAIPINSGEQITGSLDGRYQQVRDSNGNPTGTRLDKGGHKTHADPKAQGTHGHRPSVTDDKGNPHLPLNEPKPPPEPKLLTNSITTILFAYTLTHSRNLDRVKERGLLALSLKTSALDRTTNSSHPARFIRLSSRMGIRLTSKKRP